MLLLARTPELNIHPLARLLIMTAFDRGNHIFDCGPA